jgi:putative peptidoglycan lipid II flippase
MIRPFLTVSSGTLASRLLGFLRDSMIAALLGAGAVADAFLIAFQFVNVVRRLLTEGALNAALVPTWLRLREREGVAAAAAFAGRAFGTVSAAAFLAVALIGVLAPLVIDLLCDGRTAAALHPAIADAQLMLPYAMFAGPVAVMMALLNAQGRFALTAFSPLLFNIALIAAAALLLLHGADAEPRLATRVLAIAVCIAGLLQVTVLLSLRGKDFATPVRASFDPEMLRFLGRALPGMVASSAPQLLLVTAAIVASSSPSAVSWLYYANRLIELPLGLVGVAMGTVLVGELSRAVHGGDREEAARVQSRAIEMAAALALPATLGLIVLAEPIVRLLFEHGAFTANDTAATARALTWLALGLPAQVLFKSLAPAFFAREDMTPPLVAVLKAILLALAGALLFGHIFGAEGIAAGISLGAWSAALSLLREGASRLGLTLDAASRRRLPRIAAAALAMAASIWWMQRWLPAAGLARMLALAGLIAAGVAIYGSLLRLFGVLRWQETVNAFKRGPRDLRS